MRTINVKVTRFYTRKVRVRIVPMRRLAVVNHDYWKAYKSGMDDVNFEITLQRELNSDLVEQLIDYERMFGYGIAWVFATGMLFEALVYLLSM